MPNFRLRRFSSPATLRAIAPGRLLRFLEPFRAYFHERGVAIPQHEGSVRIDYNGLIRLFLSPDQRPPTELLDALYFVDEMATPHGMDVLLGVAELRGLKLECSLDLTPADVAVEVWLADRELLEREHAQLYLSKPRSFDYYHTDQPSPPPFMFPAPSILASLERDLGEWFARKKRGNITKVFAYPRDDEVFFLVRHGEPFRREESLDGEETGSVCFRPLKYDIVAYQPKIGELRINARSPAQKAQYRRQFGRHIFGSCDYFPGDCKYTLEPLRQFGEASLICADVPGIDWIRLREVHLYWGGPSKEVEIHKADDVFEALNDRHTQFPTPTRLIRAKFAFKFADSRKPRLVTIRPSNIAQYTRDEDCDLVEQWLRLRGFVEMTASDRRGTLYAHLANA